MIRGDCNYGNEENMREAEERGLCYLFKLRQTRKAKDLILFLESRGGWSDAGQGWEGIEGSLQLTGWSCAGTARAPLVVRRAEREEQSQTRSAALPLLALAGACTFESLTYQYMVLVTSAALRDRCRSRNSTGREPMWKTPLTSSKTSGAGPDLQPRISSAARSRRGSLPLSTIGGVSLRVLWWIASVIVSGHQPSRALLGGVARQTRHAGQNRLSGNLTHARSAKLRRNSPVRASFSAGL